MRIRALRDLDAGSWIDLLAVSTVTAVLGIRAYLEWTGYPTIGGESLHVAHMLWGGLLMLVALWMLLFYVGRRIRPVAAVVGGLGFGTFIDEVGKFVTHDNDYFFEPAVAIIYATIVIGYVVARAVEHRIEPSSADHLATALRDLEESILGDLDAAERQRILERLDRVEGQDRLVTAIRSHVEEALLIEARRPGWLTRASRRVHDGYRDFARSRWFVRGVLVFFVTRFLIELSFTLRLAIGAWGGEGAVTASLPDSVSAWGLSVSSALSAVFVAAGVRALLARRRLSALRRFQASILVSLLVGQVFQFHLEQWSALTGLAIQLLLFLALRYAIDHEDRVNP